ncbi:MAG: hypothetical protein CBCREVIR_0950 [Candidatus Burkholderia crenata]|nr:MAG: hypothetical protein CBCREVIR_0950 [Candidatus Burkholderia crenata]
MIATFPSLAWAMWGCPVAIAFGLQRRTIGFDKSPARLADLRAGLNRNGEISREAGRCSPRTD